MKRYTAIILSILAAIILVSCGKEEKTVDIIRPVKVCSPQQVDSLETIETSGLIVEGKEANLSFRIPGYIADLLVEEGQYVKKDQVLVKLDNKDYLHKFNAVKAEYEKIIADADRVIELYNKNSISESDYDKAVAGKKQITAKYEAEKNNLSYTELKAPFSGYVNRINFEEGEILDAGMPAISMFSDDKLQVEINLASEYFLQRNNFVDFYMELEDNPTRYPLTVKSVSMKGNNNQLYKMIFDLHNKDKRFSPGMTVEVTILSKSRERNLLKVPFRAIERDQENNYVWIFNRANKQVKRQAVTVGKVDAKGWIVIKSGLSINDEIIEAGISNLEDNMKVKAIERPSVSNYGEML